MQQNIITLDVGGTIFKAYEKTLKKSPYIKKLLRSSHGTDENPIFIDRSPDAFKHILELLRNTAYDFPDTYISDLKEYGIQHYRSKNIRVEVKETKTQYSIVVDNNSINFDKRVNGYLEKGWQFYGDLNVNIDTTGQYTYMREFVNHYTE